MKTPPAAEPAPSPSRSVAHARDALARSPARVGSRRDDEGAKIERAQDAAWRSFPIESDPDLVFRLHRFDALTNEGLAMGARAETRDLVARVCNRGETPLHASLGGVVPRSLAT
jgi:hypothetical protein